MNMQKSENPVVLAVVLLVISIVVAFLLAFTNFVTEEKINENTIKEQNAAKQEVLPAASEFEETEFSDDTGLVKAIFTGKDSSGNPVGWCANVTPSGYGGELDIMVGISKDGTLSGMKVVSHSETAGLGAKASESSFSSQFSGKKIDAPLAVIKSGTPKENEIVAISGATITSSAVKDGVNAAIDAVKRMNGGV